MLRDDARIHAAMAAHGLRALVATTAENIRYLTDYDSPALYIYRYPGSYAVAMAGRAPVLIVGMAGLEYMVERPVATKDIRTTGTYHVERRAGAALSPAETAVQELRSGCPHYDTVEEALLAVLAEGGAAGAVGMDERGVTPALWRALAGRLPGGRLTEAAGILTDVRHVKTPEELELMRQAIAINERAATRAFAVAAAGQPESAMEAAFRTEAAAAGADPGHWETTLGPRSSGSFHAAGYVGRPGDLIRSDSSLRYRGYWSDIGRTRVLGEPSTEHRRTYEAIRAGQDAIVAAVRPGARVGDLFALAVDTIRRAGIPHFRRHHVGHGIGLEMYESPLLVEGSDARLEAGMVINVEVPYYESGYGGFQIEETLLVTTTGCDVLTRADRGLASVGAP
jgi:Xaa-Pro aminopeptidase